MKVVNKSKMTSLADKAIVAHSLLKRIIGLMDRKTLEKGEALIICPCKSIHTFFMRFPIDVVFVDKKDSIIKTISCLKPFRLTRAYWFSKSVIELPAGAISSTNTRQGDILQII
jgi:uncharacterized protein